MKYKKQIYKMIRRAGVILLSFAMILASPQSELHASAEKMGSGIEDFLGTLFDIGIGNPYEYFVSWFGNEKGKSKNSGKIMVSLGDSYSSGEGIEPFYGQYDSDKTENPDWLAHRSVQSWPGQLILDGNVMKNVKDNKWFFVASSGAETIDMEGYEVRENGETVIKGQDKEVNRITAGYPGIVMTTKYLDPQFDIFDQLDQQNLKADYVTITIGGNDLGFSDVVQTCITGSSFLDHSKLNFLIDKAWLRFYFGDPDTGEAPISEQIKEVYDKIADKAGDQVRVIVAGYPKLFSDDGHILISSTEAQIVNSSVVAFNDCLEKLVEQSDRDNRAEFCFAPVIEEFEGHGAFAEDAWINCVKLIPRLEDINIVKIGSAYSVHPNELGARAYARCVQRELDRLEGVESPENAKVGPAEVVQKYIEAGFTGNHDALIECVPPELEDDTQLLSTLLGGSEWNQFLGDVVDMEYDLNIIDCHVTEYSEDGTEALVYLKYSIEMPMLAMFGQEIDTTNEETFWTKWYGSAGWRVNVGLF